MADLNGVNNNPPNNSLSPLGAPMPGGASFPNGALGKAYQSVAQSTALAVQDATDNLRNVSTISTTAIGVAMTQLMSSGDMQTWGPVILTAQSLIKSCVTDFQQIGENAARVLRDFPTGGQAPAE